MVKREKPVLKGNRLAILTVVLAFAVALLSALLMVKGTFAALPTGKGVLNAPTRPDVVLYDQYDNPGTNSTNSQDFEPANDPFDDLAADDFVVPGGQTWTITEVDVAGVYFNGNGPATHANVYFYTDANGLPGTLVASRLNISVLPQPNTGDFTLALSTGVVLDRG